jgi:hypothetical protein
MQKRRLYFTFILGTLSIALGTSVVANDGLLAIGDNSHTAYCQWNHYNRVEPTDDTRGIQEYWVCCTHHDSQLEEPTIGTISNKGNQTQNFINSLESGDVRVIPSYKDQASKVVNLINNIPQSLQGLHGSYISNAINSYELLPSQAKKYVTNYDKLTLASFDYNESYSVLIDASNNEYQTVEYSPTFDYSTGIDQTYGHYASFQNITTVNNYWVWLGKSENISIVNYEEIYFYVYNESASVRDLQFRNPKTQAQIGDYVKVAGQSWTKVNFPLAVVESGLLSNIVIAWYADGQAVGSTFADGFKFSSTIGVRYDAGLSEQSYLDASTKNFDRELDITGKESNVVDGDYSVKIETGKWSSVQGKINFITKEKYTNVASISFRFKIAGSIPTWWGIGHNTSIATANNYGDNGGGWVIVNTKNTNNAWSSVTLNLNIAEARYYHFIFAVGEYSNTVFIDDFTIKLTSGVTYTDNFNTGTSTLFNTDKAVLSSSVSFNEEKTPIKSIDTTPTDYGMVVDLKEYAMDGQATLVSYDRFTNVTKISFQYKFVGDTQFRTESTWLGFAVDDSKNIYSGWSGQMVNPKGNVEPDTWYTFEKIISSASGYIYFVAAAGEFSGEDCKVVIDNFAATTAEELISDTFSNAASWYFELGANCSIGVANSSTVAFNGGTTPGNDDGYAKIDAYNYGNTQGNAATLVTKTKYTNVTQITSNVKIDGEGEIEISLNDKKALFIFDNMKISTRLIEGNYPETARLIPSEFEYELIIEARTLLNAINRASFIKNDGVSIIKMDLASGEVVITSKSSDVGSVETIVPDSYEGNNLSIAFKGQYVYDAIRVLNAFKIKVQFGGTMKPFIITSLDNEDVLQLVLPIKTYN